MKNLFTYLKALWSSMGNLQSSDVSLDRRSTVVRPSGLEDKLQLNTFVRFAVVLTLIFTIGSGNVWGKEGDELAVCQGTGSGYGTRRTLTDSHSVDWVLASGQSGYLGANSDKNHAKVMPTAVDLPVVKAQNASATTSTTGYYFYYTSTAISNVGSIVFSYTANSGNNSATAYIVSSSTAASSGSATWSKPTLASGTGLSAQGVNLGTSGTFTFQLSATETSAKYYGIIIVTETYKRMTDGTITIKEGATGGGSTPTITKSSDFSTFGYSSGSPVAQSFTVSGTNLTANLVVTAPSNYEVCKTENGTYGSSVSFTPSTGSVSDETVYIRLESGLSAGNYNYTSTSAIRLTSAGATEVDIAINGMVPYTINWETNGSNHTTTYVDYGGTLTLPNTSPSTSCGGRVFVGWYEGSYSHATDAPTFAKTGDAVTGSTTHTFNAVYAMCDDDSPTSITSFATGDYYLIAYYASASKYYAMTGSTSSGITATDVTSAVSYDGTDKILTITNTASFSSSMVYTISGTTSAAYIKQGLTDVGNTSGTNFGTGAWAVTSYDDNTFRFSGNSRCILFKNDPIFKNYATSNASNTGYGDGSLYLVPVPTYSDFTTTCAACTADPSITGVSLIGSAFSTTSVPVQATGVSAGTNCSLSSYGFYWGTSASPSGNSTASNNLSAGTFSATLTGPFDIGTTYHYRAWATNNGDNTGYSSDVTFTLRQISFNMHGHGGDAPANQVVNNGGKATDPGDPSEAGWTFGGWYNNDSYTGSAWVFGTNTVSGGNVTLHAKWTEKPKYTITLNAGNGTVSAAGWTAGDSPTWTKTQSNGDEAIEFPSASCNCAGWEFVGWATSAANNVSSDPTSKAAGDELVPASNVTYYAVYRQNATGGTTYNKITSTGDLTTGDYIIISSSSYAMKNEVNLGGTYMNESSNGTFSASGSSIETSASEYIWTIVKFGSQVVIKNGTDFLGINDNNNICLSTTPHFFTYTYNTTNSRWEFTSATKTTYQLVYNSYFKMLTSQSTAIYLYKQGAGLTGNYYTNPTCSDLSITGEADPAAGGSVTLSATSAKSGEKVYAYYTEDPAYRFNSWSVSGTGASISSTTAKFTEITVGSADVTLTANFDARVMYSVTWKANGEELTGGDLGSASTSVETGEKITNLPPAPSSCDGTSTAFVGWIAESEIWGGKTDDVSAKHIYTAASEIPAVTGAVTYHAVWAQVDSENASWKKVTSVDDLQDGETVAFISAGDGYYLPNTASASGNAPSLGTVTKTSGDINFVNEMKFTAIYNSTYDGFTFESVSATGKYLWVYNDNKGIYISATDENKSNSSNIWYLEDFDDANSTSTGYGIGMYATTGTGNYRYLTTYGTNDWRSYKSTSVGTGTPANLLANIYRYADAYKQYLVKCCNTPTLTFAASPYAVLREDIQGASTTTWAEVDVTFTSNNTTGTISVPDYGSSKSVYKLSAWESRATTGGTLCATDQAYLEVLDQPKGATPGTGKFHVKTTSGQTGQGTYRIAITQAATDESHGNFCETTVYGFVDVTLRDKFVDNVNGNGTINRDGHGAQLATPTLSEFGTQEEDACHSEGRKLKGWIKETDLKAQYETGSSTRVQTVDGLCETCADGTDQTSLIVAPGANVTMSGATWYAVWAYEK